MKNATFSFALVCAFILAATDMLSAQITAYWKGGTPGRASDWTCAKNWSNQRVPNEFTDVVIPNVAASTRVYPVIEFSDEVINSLVIHTNAAITVQESGSLIVLNQIYDSNNRNARAQNHLDDIFEEANSVSILLPATPDK